MLGPEPFTQDEMRKNVGPGVVTGLAWTETGGDVLYIEATLLPDGKGLTLTGQLGDVMKESAKAAQSWVWSHAEELGIDPGIFKTIGRPHPRSGRRDPEGRTFGRHHDGDRAGFGLHRRRPARNDTAMTGEITLSGLVLPIGGVKEKVLAARRLGIKRVILPKANQKDLARAARCGPQGDGVHLRGARRRGSGECNSSSSPTFNATARLIQVVEGSFAGPSTTIPNREDTR